MFCPKCRKINPDTDEKCSGCGTVLHEEVTESSGRKSKKLLKTIIAVVLVVAIVVVAVVLLNGCGGEAPDLKDRITY